MTFPIHKDTRPTRYCSECAACERKEVATTSVSYQNDRGRYVRCKHVCADHADMLLSDYLGAKETGLLPRTKAEAREWINCMTPNLLEIVNGHRVGIPTLDLHDPRQRAAGILSGKPVSWIEG